MKTRKSSLELTPLLDVVLIILFVFMMLLANQLMQSTSVKEKAEAMMEAMEADLDKAQKDNEDFGGEIAQLQEDYDKLMLSSELTSEQLEHQKDISDKQAETAENLAKAAAEFMGDNQADIQKLLYANDPAAQELLENMTAETAAEQMLKYEALSRQFYFIDIEIKTADNRLYINDTATSLGISHGEVSDDAGRQDKIDKIKRLIEEDLERRQGGSQMVFISLIVKDRDVYHYAWETVWDAVGEIQEKYGTDKIFRTHITLIEN